ncbi:hypothetical protein IC762_28205 [Bradyrhizobium genosp. L]|uniref:hypothetical protein n=1 Tax=Bradyrhizobium genosp. L TaxID=83637 RepID=UPI0018A2778D|nr:hypothetical protein [Bradyrhizobium genosp. L]QPF83555.1 hypothetical protein IC762_28205 [Bradyrhizobium genosp. L]
MADADRDDLLMHKLRRRCVIRDNEFFLPDPKEISLFRAHAPKGALLAVLASAQGQISSVKTPSNLCIIWDRILIRVFNDCFLEIMGTLAKEPQPSLNAAKSLIAAVLALLSLRFFEREPALGTGVEIARMALVQQLPDEPQTTMSIAGMDLSRLFRLFVLAHEIGHLRYIRNEDLARSTGFFRDLLDQFPMCLTYVDGNVIFGGMEGFDREKHNAPEKTRRLIAAFKKEVERNGNFVEELAVDAVATEALVSFAVLQLAANLEGRTISGEEAKGEWRPLFINLYHRDPELIMKEMFKARTAIRLGGYLYSLTANIENLVRQARNGFDFSLPTATDLLAENATLTEWSFRNDFRQFCFDRFVISNFTKEIPEFIDAYEKLVNDPCNLVERRFFTVYQGIVSWDLLRQVTEVAHEGYRKASDERFVGMDVPIHEPGAGIEFLRC